MERELAVDWAEAQAEAQAKSWWKKDKVKEVRLVKCFNETIVS